MTLPNSKTRKRAELEAHIIALFTSGLNTQEIAHKIGHPEHTVYNLLARLGK